MTLAPDAATTGLWKADGVGPAGVHAIVIGISDYPHLDGGTGPPAPATAGMGQLEVCAKTAARVFDWLRRRSKVAGAPLATCRLLLAPRPGERAEVAALTRGAYADATYAAIRTAIEAWRDAIAAGGSDPVPNVAFFFFSGHGLEHLASPALLARDILDPRTPGGPDNAVSFNGLWQAVRTYGVDRALFFIDACRNAPELAKTLHIVGQEVIRPAVYPGKAPDAVVWLQATRMGDFAYQLPGAPATIFGQGLLEALEGMPPEFLPYDRTVTPWRLVFSNLESHVKQKVRELLARHTATRIQPVEPGGYPYNGEALVAEMAPAAPPPSPAPPSPPLPPSPAPPGVEWLVAAGAIDAPTRDLIGRRSATILKTFHRTDLSAAKRGLSDPGVMHQVFRHESVTAPWIETLRILDVDSGGPAENAPIVASGQSQEVDGQLTAWVDMHVSPDAGRAVWIQAGGDRGQGTRAVVVPRDQHMVLPLRLDVAFAKASGDWKWTLESMTARIASPDGLPGDAREVWGPLWEVQRVEALTDLARAGRAAVQLNILEAAVREKFVSPAAAAVGCALLLRVGALGPLHDWPRNLADWFGWLPDGSVLWAETLLRRGEAAAPSARPAGAIRPGGGESERRNALRALAGRADQIEARRYFAQMAERGAPLLTPVLAMAARQAALWRQVLQAEALDRAEAAAVAAACDVAERASAYAVSDGLFGAFVCHEADFGPSAVFGTRRRA